MRKEEERTTEETRGERRRKGVGEGGRGHLKKREDTRKGWREGRRNKET